MLIDESINFTQVRFGKTFVGDAMPKLGMEPVRKAALVDATIVEIGRAGSLDVTVGQIARRAGMSPALAHHYFGGKEAMLLAAMRHVLTVYGAEVRGALAVTSGAEARLRAIVMASFSPTNFRRDVIGAWLNFYVLAQTLPQACRLLGVYQRRLSSNLVHCLRPTLGRAEARRVAEGLGALIDGLYLREALKQGAPDAAGAVATVESYVRAELRGRSL